MDIAQNLKQLTPYQYWLLDHQITAFWHGFGISNGLYIRKDDIQEGRYASGEKWVRVKPEKMREVLTEYLTWLRKYRESALL